MKPCPDEGRVAIALARLRRKPHAFGPGNEFQILAIVDLIASTKSRIGILEFPNPDALTELLYLPACFRVVGMYRQEFNFCRLAMESNVVGPSVYLGQIRT